MSNEQINNLKKMKRKDPIFTLEEDTAATAMIKKNIVDDSKKRLSVHLSKSLELEFRVFAKRKGKTVSEFLNDELKSFFENTSETELINDYVEDESINRGYNLESPVMLKLNEYCQTNRYSKRFVVESILSQSLKKK